MSNKVYTLRFSKTAVKTLKKLGPSEKSYLLSWIEKNLININNKEEQLKRLKPLKKDLKGSYKIRVGNYRLICHKNDVELIILSVIEKIFISSKNTK